MTGFRNTHYSDRQGRNPGTISSSLLTDIKADRPAAWNRTVRLYTPLIFYWCRRQGLQPADAEDIVQEVLRTVAARVADFQRNREGDTFRGWLRTITRNKIGDYIRAQKQRPDGPNSVEQIQEVPQCRHANGNGKDSQQDLSSEVRVLHATVLDLIHGEFEESTWRAFLRVVVDGVRPTDVANELQMSVNAVYLAKSRVLRRVRDQLREAIG